MLGPHTRLEVRHGTSLPLPVHSDTLAVTRGYAVHHEGPTYTSEWLFFAHLEPAWVYGRAVGASPLTTSWTIRQAALSHPPNTTGEHRVVLHLAGLVPRQPATPFETRTLERWVEGITDASHWTPLY